MSASAASIDLSPDDFHEVLRILNFHLPAVEVRVFGSRATGTAKTYSDLDLALMTDQPLSLAQEAELHEAFDESALPFKVDLVDWAATSKTFQQIIAKDSVVIRGAQRNVSSDTGLV